LARAFNSSKKLLAVYEMLNFKSDGFIVWGILMA